MRLRQAPRKISGVERSKAVRTLETLQSRREADEAPVYIFAKRLWLHLYENAEDPGPIDKTSSLLACLALMRAATLLEQDGSSGAALLCLAAAHELSPQHETLSSLAELLRRERHLEDAVLALSELMRVEDRSKRKARALELARLLEELNRHGEAADLYGEAALEFPDTPEFLAGQARCLEATRRFAELIPVLERQLAVEKSDARSSLLHTRLATLLESVSRDEESAVQHYREAIRLAPNYEPPMQALLSLAERRADWATLVDVLKARLRIEKRHKERATILARIGEIVAHSLGDPQRGLHYLERAIREYPRGLPARLTLLEILCEEGEFIRAERFATPPDVSETQGLNSDQLAHLCQIRARVAAERGRPLEALSCLSLALELAPKPRPVLEDVIALLRRDKPEAPPLEILTRRAREWERGGKPELASLALQAQGLLLLYQGSLEHAEACLRRAAELSPQDPAPYELLGDLNVALRHFDEATVAYLQGAATAIASEARLTLRAAEVATNHLHQPERALQLLLDLHRRGVHSAETSLLGTELALSTGRTKEAWALLDLAARVAPPQELPRVQGLRVQYWQSKGIPEDEVQSLLEEAAGTGDLRSVHALAGKWLAHNDAGKLEALLESLGASASADVWCVAADAYRLAKQPEPALSWYRRALERQPEQRLRALEGIALIAPLEALLGIERWLLDDPFNPAALHLLGGLLRKTGQELSAPLLIDLCFVLSTGAGPPLPPRPSEFWRGLEAKGPFFELTAQLRRQVPQAFVPLEESLRSQAQPRALSSRLTAALEEVCRARDLRMPRLMVHPLVQSAPIATEDPPTLLLSPRLFEPEMPEGAALFSLLQGVGMLGLGAAPLSYLSLYQCEMIAEALRVAASTEGSPSMESEGPAQVLLNALDVPVADAQRLIRQVASQTGASAVDAGQARLWLEGELIRQGLRATGDLVGALSALALLPPPTIAYRATGPRWLRQLGRLQSARAAVGYTLSAHSRELESLLQAGQQPRA